jgi:hypothetical protein
MKSPQVAEPGIGTRTNLHSPRASRRRSETRTGLSPSRNGAVTPATLARAVAMVGLWSASVSIALFAPVQAMDADVMITIAFCLEVVLFGLGAWIFAARELRDARVKAPAMYGGEPGFPRPRTTPDDGEAADTARPTSAWRSVVS